MFVREFKINLKSLIIWTSVLILLYLMAFAIYPSIMSSDNIKAMEEMLKVFPEAMLKAFNMDIASISSVSGWIKSEGIVFYMLVGGIYSAILGSNILLKEESEGTIEYLYAKPISRNKIILSKYLCGLLNILILVFVITLTIIVGLAISDDLVIKDILLLMLTPLLVFYSMFTVMMLVSTFFTKTKKTIGISFAIVFLSYFMQVISLMSDKVSWLKYLSLFTLSNSRSIIENSSISLLSVLIGIFIIGLSTTGLFFNYNKKDLV